MDLTSAIINQASAMSTARLKSEMSVQTFKKAMDFQEQAALTLLQTVNVRSTAESQAMQSAGLGKNVDLVV